ncbi:MAG: hypothetical protein IJV51_02830 [Oscillospiraceae bacterium]|nr:hypothetical protein [Oscillospiraceae bacterium]
MSKHVRKILPLLLCLLLMACLLPAAYADGAEVSMFDDLQSAINSGAASCTFTGKAGGPNQGLTLTVPAGFTLNIPSGFLCLDDLTVNGTLNVTNEGMLIVNESLTGSGAVNVAAGCLLNLPAACYDSESHALVSLIHNSSDNVTLVHTPANQAELRSATGKAQDAAGHGFKNGFLFLQDLTISNGAIMFFDGEILSVQNNATLTISEDAVIVSDETIMVENGNIRVLNGGRLVSNVELRPGTADFTGGGYFGGETIKVTNTANPDSCVTGLDILDMSQFDRKEKNGYVIFERVSEAPEITALRNAIADPNVSGFTLAGNGPVVLTRDLIVPKGFELTVANQLVIASGAQLMMNGFDSRAVVTGDITIAEGGSLLSMGKINLAETGTLHVSGTFTGTPGSSVEVHAADLTNIQPRVIVNFDSGEFNGMGGVAISKTLLEDYNSGGVDRSQIIDVPNMGAWSEIEAEDAVGYFPGKDIDPEIFPSMCESGRFSQIRLRGTGDLTLTANLTIPEGFYLKVRNDSKLIVPEGKTLGVDGEIEISEGGEIYVAGKLETKPHEGAISMYEGGMLRVTGEFNNNNFVMFGKSKLNDKVAPKLIIENGASYKDGGLRVRRNLDVNAVVQGIDMSDYCRHVDHRYPENVYYPGSMLNFEGMFPVGGKYIERLEVHGLDTYTLSGSVEIPVFDDGTAATVDMSETKLVIPNGKTLHVRGELSIKDLVVENGGGLLLHGNGTVAVAGELNNSSAVVVMDNSVLNVSGEMVNRDALRVEGNSSVTVSGKLTNNATIGIGENAQIAVSGEFVNNRLINLRNWNGTRPLITIGAQGKYEEHGGFDVLTQFDYESAISAIDLSDYCRLVYVTADNNHVTRLFPGRDLNFDPNGFKQMCQNGDTVYLEIRGRETFQMDSDVTIPNVMEVVANDVDLVIPAGVNVKLKGHMILRNGAALDLKGKLSEGTLGLDEGTAVNLTGQLDVDELRLDGQITVGSGATLDEAKLIELANGRPNGGVTVADASAKAYIRSDGLSEALMPAWITLQGDETTARVYYHAKSDTDFTNMTAGIGNLPASLAGALTIEYPATIRGNVDFPGTELRVAGQKGGSLTVAEGAVLRASNVNIKSANVTISGTFIAAPSYRHSGSLTLNADNGVNSTLTVTDTGILGGYQCTVEVPKGIETASCVFGFNPGQMKDVSHPYRPNYQIYLIVAEMSLPSGLTTIESEAFAGGSFNSVYIPNSVTSIAFDAFGDRTDLKVYGEYGTAAETFAHDHSFPFAPPNLATQPA